MNDDLLARLRKALAGRIGIERELGRGGMGVVYLARDERTSRAIALKVLRPEISAVLGPERFLREIAIAVELKHPNLVPLLDTGEADGLVYFTMPFVDGPTVREHLDQDGPFPVHEAVEIASQVAAGLGYAHEHGVIHRDVKPENVLLAGNQSLLADFGIARVLGGGGAEALTSTGIAVGTPAYMSPEQGASDRVDERTDQYSLGCVLYEMLAGTPPFSGPDSRAILARQALDPVPPLRTLRPTVPEALEQVIVRALAKHPADRWPSIGAFADALRGAITAEPSASSVPIAGQRRVPPRPLLSRRLPWLTGAAVVGVLAYVATHGQQPPLDPELIALLPFRIEGSLDGAPSPRGIVDLLGNRIDGVGRLRVASAGSVNDAPTSATAAQRTARRLGAGLVLTGQLFAGPKDITLDALLRRSEDGHEVARVDGLTQPADRLPMALDRVAITLLARALGEPEFRVPGLTTRQPDVVKAYLDARLMLRRGRYRDAVARIQRALAADSTFALAGMLGYLAGSLSGQESEAGGAYFAAVSHKTTLATPDGDFLTTLSGPRAPLPSPYVERLQGWSRLVLSYPDSRDAAFAMSEELRDWGPATGNPAAHAQAANLLRQALRDDSASAPILERLLDLAMLSGDTAEVRRLAAIYLARNPDADQRGYVRWQAAMALGQPRHIALAESLAAGASTGTLRRMLLAVEERGRSMEDARFAVAELLRRAGTPLQTLMATVAARELAHNTGRPSEAPAFPAVVVFDRPIEPMWQVLTTLFWDGDSASAARVVRQRAPALEGSPPPPDATDARYWDVCTVGLWRSAEGDWAAVRKAAERLGRAEKAAERGATGFIPVCQAILKARLEAAAGPSAVAPMLVRLDSVAASAPVTNGYILLAANLTTAALREARGEIPAALAAVRRRSYASGFAEVGLSTYLREEGRLAALAGEREAAVQAYQQYLALRRDPDPRLRGQRDAVRDALRELLPDRP